MHEKQADCWNKFSLNVFRRDSSCINTVKQLLSRMSHDILLTNHRHKLSRKLGKSDIRIAKFTSRRATCMPVAMAQMWRSNSTITNTKQHLSQRLKQANSTFPQWHLKCDSSYRRWNQKLNVYSWRCRIHNWLYVGQCLHTGYQDSHTSRPTDESNRISQGHQNVFQERLRTCQRFDIKASSYSAAHTE